MTIEQILKARIAKETNVVRKRQIQKILEMIEFNKITENFDK